MEKNILCYGDSNTWGYVAGSRDYQTMYVERYDTKTRWPMVLQQKLGSHYRIIEEGLNNRTTNLDDPYLPDCNGKNYLLPCLYSHAPLNLVILALGGNDLGVSFNRTVEEVTTGLGELVDLIQTSQYGPDMLSPPQVLIVSQFIPLPISETLLDRNGKPYLENPIQKARALLPCYRALAQEKICAFLDISENIIPSEIDGIHLDVTGHQKMAELLFDKVKNIFSQQSVGA